MLCMGSFKVQQAALSEAEKDEQVCSDAFPGIPGALAMLLTVLKVFQTCEICAVGNIPLISEPIGL